MPTYVYEALNSAGKPHKGTIEANSSEEAIQRKIRNADFEPLGLIAADGSATRFAAYRRASAGDDWA